METNRKRAKVIMLPTDDGNHTIWKTNSGQLIHTHVSGEFKEKYVPQHLYFITDDEIKKGDWYYTHSCKSIHKSKGDEIENNEPKHKDYKKIVATTDKSLTVKTTRDEKIVKPGIYEKSLPQPSQAFIEKYCELGGGIDEVEIECKSIAAGELKGIPTRLKIQRIKVDPNHNTITIHPITSREEQAWQFLQKINEEWGENWDLIVDFFGEETANELDKILTLKK